MRYSTCGLLIGTICLTALLTGSSVGTGARAAQAPRAARPLPASTSYLLSVTPDVVTAGQHLGGPGEPALAFEFPIPSNLRGGGWPTALLSGYDGNRSVLQIELPSRNLSAELPLNSSTGAGLFDRPRVCHYWVANCQLQDQDGYWTAIRIRSDGTTQKLQMALPEHDPLALIVYPHIVGVYWAAWQVLGPGDRVRLMYKGHVPARATDWTGHPLRAHFRYRSFSFGPDRSAQPGPWTTLSDEQVQPLEIKALPDPAFVSVMAPLDLQAGVPFKATIVVTDRFGNPRPVTGPVSLGDGVTDTVSFSDEWRREVTEIYRSPGSYRVVASLPGARSIYHYSRVWDGPPPVQRLVGDLQIHTGDGAIRQKFLGYGGPGDHSAFFTETDDALGYLEKAAGYDFGAVSEHAVRTDDYVAPAAVLADPEFSPGGRCVGAVHPIHGLGDWWTNAQSVARAYASGGSFIVFPAFEWWSVHVSAAFIVPQHRVVLYRDFDPTNDLPVLPSDVKRLPPQCLIRFLSLAGYGPDRALVIPHLMIAAPYNLDWDLSYSLSPIASLETVEAYEPVGELFSARAYDQKSIASAPYFGRATWTAFEGSDDQPGAWSFRHGWRNRRAHIGVVGSSDSHTEMPGVNDAMAPDGSRYHSAEPAGSTIALAGSPDRNGVFDALRARATYATTGVRAWLAFDVDGSPTGSRIQRSVDQVPAAFDLMAGMTITRVEIWGAQVGNAQVPYRVMKTDAPNAEVDSGTVVLQNPVPAGGRPQEWLYYVRAFLETPGAEDGEPDDAVWSSPVWVTWSR